VLIAPGDTLLDTDVKIAWAIFIRGGDLT
jgi:hypothetical protein